MLASLNGRDLVIGVDRLDYSKGLKQRMEAFATFLERSPQAARARVTMLQITPKSRSEVPEYARYATRIGGRGRPHQWQTWRCRLDPLRYINKSMSHSALAGLFRMSRIGLVTPLRDGMNLVAKEYVAAQAPDNPGVLVLSQFAGAAQELKSALIVNPYDIEATAAAIARAFTMALDEREDRWHALMAVLRANSVHDGRLISFRRSATKPKAWSSTIRCAETALCVLQFAPASSSLRLRGDVIELIQAKSGVRRAPRIPSSCYRH